MPNSLERVFKYADRESYYELEQLTKEDLRRHKKRALADFLNTDLRCIKSVDYDENLTFECEGYQFTVATEAEADAIDIGSEDWDTEGGLYIYRMGDE